ncbi:MAG TPA: hypothetical protein PK951_00740 [Chitinophagaceae bacterium]|nr:hypothetical protein [Chitinophagaceae bacterium]HUM64285.1 hypothetical protein [Chitinophagaceae bacterium]
MESNYRNKEFEHFLKQNADQYRMFPSDKVWKGINNTLHTRRKWYGFWLASLLLITGAAVTWVMTTQPGTKQKSTIIPVNHASVLHEDEITAEESTAVMESLNPFANKPVLPKKTIAEWTLTPLTSETAEVKALDEEAYNDVVKLLNRRAENVIRGNELTLPVLNHIAFDNDFRTPAEPALTKTDAIHETAIDNKAPFTIESVTNSYEFKRPAKKISWQLFITPTISYRKLSVNKTSDNPSGFNYPFATLDDVNSAVTHKPDMGLQLGLSGRYPITRNINLRGGIQFNINRYDIKAYAFNGEVATIDLNGGNGNSSISTWTYYRNYTGYKSDWLKNYYFSVSAPFGAEVKLFGNSKTNVGVAGTLQPTYIIKDRAYLISTDYKNYAEVPRLIRHVNLNTSFETFVNYTRGKTKWQVGPQIRYQMLSSFHNKYPVKENLFDFGVKVGVTLNE